MSLPLSYRHATLSPSISSPSQRMRSSGGLNSKEANISPFVTSTANPNFSPQRVGTRPAQVQPVSLKPPKGPEKPLMPYMRYSKSVWDTIKQQNQHLKLWEIGRIIGSMWRDLPESEKQHFVAEYDAEKAEYERSIKEYHSSASYQAYLSAKNKAAEEQVPHIADPKPAAVTVAKNVDRRIEIQPAEDDEDQDDQFSVKQVSHSRYVRNHRLIAEIFSDVIVPDVRTVVTTPRMSLLKRQVHSLTMHQKKLEGELQQIEEKFEAKRRRFEESTVTFTDDLKKLCEKKIDDSMFQEMVVKQTEILIKEQEEQEQKNRQAQLDAAASQVEKPSQEDSKQTVDTTNDEKMETEEDKQQQNVEVKSEPVAAAEEQKSSGDAPMDTSSAECVSDQVNETAKEAPPALNEGSDENATSEQVTELTDKQTEGVTSSEVKEPVVTPPVDSTQSPTASVQADVKNDDSGANKVSGEDDGGSVVDGAGGAAVNETPSSTENISSEAAGVADTETAAGDVNTQNTGQEADTVLKTDTEQNKEQQQEVVTGGGDTVTPLADNDSEEQQADSSSSADQEKPGDQGECQKTADNQSDSEAAVVQENCDGTMTGEEAGEAATAVSSTDENIAHTQQQQESLSDATVQETSSDVCSSSDPTTTSTTSETDVLMSSSSLIANPQ